MLACGGFTIGSFLDKDAGTIALLIFGVYPLVYFAFIHSFRYRVSRPIPMKFRHALRLTMYCLLLGIAICALSFGVNLLGARGPRGVPFVLLSILFLYCARIFCWWLVGAKGAGLVGRRLLGWIISGTLINAAFDVALVSGLFQGWRTPLITLGCMVIFIYALHAVGRRDSLKLRFLAEPHCRNCSYNLTGNISGICPECGTPIDLSLLNTT
jgi:hypothetical protein